ncbi:MAG: nucleoside triphosphate pyrophosphohydrolase [Nanoarchaeota archaeon]|nr:nucleoside triphosphate pyrophosphohydrolase [Nanoarchaeota archaeon]MBU4086630.1 nucleoside triphosphate pyrophosphohydrolase [Nanoarchaeota archaeon]
MKKLVRDKIPEIIEKAIIHVADNNEYWNSLKDKLIEETNEFINNNSQEELADILEVTYSICSYKNLKLSDIERIKTKKSEEKGGFKNKIILESIP